MGLSQTMRTSFDSLPYGISCFLRLYTLSAGIVPATVFIAVGTEEIPQIIAGNHILIGTDFIAETISLFL